MVAGAVGAAAARALLMALRDDYAARGLWDPAVRSASHDLLDGLMFTLPAALLLRLAGALVGERAWPRGLVFGVTVVLADLFVVGRLPMLGFHAPGFEGMRAWSAHAGGLAAASVVALVLLSRGRPLLAVLARALLSEPRLSFSCASPLPDGGVMFECDGFVESWSPSHAR